MPEPAFVASIHTRRFNYTDVKPPDQQSRHIVLKPSRALQPMRSH